MDHECPRQDLNLYAVKQRDLNPPCLPIPPRGRKLRSLDSNQDQTASEAAILPLDHSAMLRAHTGSHSAITLPRVVPDDAALSSGGEIRTRDLEVMSLTSYQTAPPRTILEARLCKGRIGLPETNQGNGTGMCHTSSAQGGIRTRKRRRV